jgi:hypothetical protein
MQKNKIGKILAVGIIIMFISVGVHPAFAVNTRQSIVDKASEDDCGCEDIDKKQLDELEKQLNRLEVYSKLILVLSKHNPELSELSEELSNRITILMTLNGDNTAICLILYSMATVIASLALPFLPFLYIFPEDGVLYNILFSYLNILDNIFYQIWDLMFDYNCPPF